MARLPVQTRKLSVHRIDGRTPSMHRTVEDHAGASTSRRRTWKRFKRCQFRLRRANPKNRRTKTPTFDLRKPSVTAVFSTVGEQYIVPFLTDSNQPSASRPNMLLRFEAVCSAATVHPPHRKWSLPPQDGNQEQFLCIPLL